MDEADDDLPPLVGENGEELIEEAQPSKASSRREDEASAASAANVSSFASTAEDGGLGKMGDWGSLVVVTVCMFDLILISSFFYFHLCLCHCCSVSTAPNGPTMIH